MEKAQLKNYLQSKFNINNWIQILRFLVDERKYLTIHLEPKDRTNELKDQRSKDIFRQIKEIGVLKTSDGASLPLFDIELTDAVHIEYNKVGVNSLLKKMMSNNAYKGLIATFHYPPTMQDEWRFSFISKSSASDFFAEIEAKETNPKKYTYIFGTNEEHRTAIDRLYTLKQSRFRIDDFFDAFNVEPVSKGFFNEYKNFYLDFSSIAEDQYNHIFEQNRQQRDDETDKEYKENVKRDTRNFVKRLLSRIVFLYFLQKKKWIAASDIQYKDGDTNFLENLFNGQYGAIDKNEFYNSHLTKLFFEALNKPNRKGDLYTLPNGSKKCIPFLNGGLFEEQQEPINHRKIIFPAYLFEELFRFFNSYNFTIYENSPQEHTIAVDPEMLGHIFENLLEDNKDKGAFYTPKEIVQYMTQESLIQYLYTSLPKVDKSKIDQLVREHNIEVFESEIETIKAIEQAIDQVKICDPAIGSGAFPMGLLQEMFSIKALIHYQLKDNQVENKKWSPATVKQNIIQKSIYGVDIEIGAVDIARLRFWLSLVVDEDLPKPLPNLDYKIICGNSVLSFEDDIVRNVDLQKKIEDDKKDLFETKDADRKKELRTQINDDIRKLLDETEPFIGYKIDFDFKLFFSEVWNENDKGKDGFDIIIGNPPYIKEYTNKKAFDGFREHSKYYQGKMDIWYGIASICLDLLKIDTGILSFIATNNWTTNSGASKMREEIIKKAQILSLIDFGDYKIFNSAGIQTMIMLFRRQRTNNEYSFNYRKINKKSPTFNDVLIVLDKTNNKLEIQDITISNQLFQPNKLKGKVFTFSNEKNSSLLEILKNKQNFYLNDRTEVAQGIVAPQDSLNKKNKELLGEKYTINEGIFVLTNSEKSKLKLSRLEESLLKPYYTTEQIQRYTVDKEEKYWIIYTNSEFKKESSLNNYPTIKSHLDRFKSIITSDNKPYGLHRARDERFFIDKKIIVQRKCAGKPIFSYASFNTYVSQTYNIIKTDRINIEYLTGLLNSKLIEFWLLNQGKMQGNNYQLDKEPLLEIPIFMPIDKYSLLIQKLVSYIIYLKQNKSNINEYTTNDALALMFEETVDAMVYELYFEEHLKELNLDVINLVCQSLNRVANLPMDDQINDLFKEWNEYENELRNRIILQRTRSHYVSTIEKALDK